MAFESQITKLYWSTSTDATSASVATSASNAVGQIVSIGGPDGVGPTIDISNLDSTRREFLMGLPDEGNIALTCWTDTTNLAQAHLRADMGTRTKRKAVILFADNATEAVKTRLIVDAFCLGFTYSFGVDAGVQSNVTLKCAAGATLSSVLGTVAS